MSREDRTDRGRRARRCLAILILGLGVATLSGNAPDPEGGPIKAAPNELKAQNLAWALGMNAWSYHLKFEKPITYINARPCELRRQDDGTWKREYLTISAGMGFGEEKSEVDVEFYIMGEPGAKQFALIVAGTRIRGKLENPPNLDNTATTPTAARFMDGRLVLAREVKEGADLGAPDEDVVRVIAIEIDTKHPFGR